jgi:hypothetical protein
VHITNWCYTDESRVFLLGLECAQISITIKNSARFGMCTNIYHNKES